MAVIVIVYAFALFNPVKVVVQVVTQEPLKVVAVLVGLVMMSYSVMAAPLEFGAVQVTVNSPPFAEGCTSIDACAIRLGAAYGVASVVVTLT